MILFRSCLDFSVFPFCQLLPLPYWYLVSRLFNFAFFAIIKKSRNWRLAVIQPTFKHVKFKRKFNYHRKNDQYVITTTYTAYLSTNTQIQNTGFTCKFHFIFSVVNNVNLQRFLIRIRENEFWESLNMCFACSSLSRNFQKFMTIWKIKWNWERLNREI